MSVSVFIQTLNEEKNLPRCLASLSWSDDIVVLDSYSSDRTLEIARTASARIYQRDYDGRANNQNWAVANIEFKYPWVWYVDADEVTTSQLAKEIMDVSSRKEAPEVVYYVRRRNMFMGRWLRYGGCYSTWIPRLWKPDHIRWERDANPVAIIDGPRGYLTNDFVHYPFSKGMSDWFERHNKYSTYEAQAFIKEVRRKLEFRQILSRDPTVRRKFLKQLAYRLPCRPFLVFCYMYFVQLGFLDGMAGLTYCRLRAIYEYMIDLKVKALRRRDKGLSM